MYEPQNTCFHGQYKEKIIATMILGNFHIYNPFALMYFHLKVL